MNLIEARHIDKSLGGRRVLRNAHLSIAEGERVVLVGANGSGKSTMLHVIAGVLEPDDGTVTRAPNLDLGFAPEKPDLPEHLVVAEWLDTIAAFKRVRNNGRNDASFGISEFRRKKTTALSLGQKQRVSLAAAWIGSPNLLVLDEPTNALDAATREDVIARIRMSTALIATHDRELAAAVATRIVELGQ